MTPLFFFSFDSDDSSLFLSPSLSPFSTLPPSSSRRQLLRGAPRVSICLRAHLLDVSLGDKDADGGRVLDGLAHLRDNVAGHLVLVDPDAQAAGLEALGHADDAVVVAAAPLVRAPVVRLEKKERRGGRDEAGQSVWGKKEGCAPWLWERGGR